MKRLIFLILVTLLPIGADMGVNAQELTVSDIEFIDVGYNDEPPVIILTKEGPALHVHIMNYSAHPDTEEFVITPKISDGSDGEPCSVSIGVSYINYSYTAVITTFNVSFNVYGIEANSFYFSCWWYKGMVSLTEGEPLELWENKNISKDGVIYTLDNKTKTATLSSGRYIEGEYNIPSELDYGGQTFLLTNIEYPAFAFNTSLTSVIIPQSVTNIGNAVFYRCSNLSEVYCYAENVPETGIDVFKDCPIASATLHVPAGSIEAYKATSPWCEFGTIVGIPEEYYPEGTRWTEIRLDTLKYNSWYSKVGDDWVPNFETIEYRVQGECSAWDEVFKKVYSNGPEWTDSLAFLLLESGHNVETTVIVEDFVMCSGATYQFNWSVGMRSWFQDILEANATCFPPCGLYNYGMIDEIKEGVFGGVRPLKYVDLNGKAPTDPEQPWLDYADTKGGRIIQGIGITEWNDGECLFGPPNPYYTLYGWTSGYKDRHYRSMLVHFERNNEVLYDVWPKKEIPSGITIKGSQSANQGALYDLQGRKVANPRKGIYIKDGNKILIK